SSTRSPKSFAALMAKIHSDFILPQKSCLESLVAMGILNQRLFDDYGCDSQKAELGQEQISLLVDAYLTLILTFMTMSEKDKTIHMPLILEIFYDAMVFQHKNRLSLLSIIQDEEFDVSIGGLKSSIAQIILAYQEHAPLKCSMEHLTFLIDIIFDAMIGIKDIVAVEKEDTYEELLSNAQSLLTSLLSFEDNSVKCELLFKLKEKYCEASLALQGATISKEVRLSFKELGANLFKNFMGFSTQESNEDKKALFKQAAKEMNVSLKLFNIS
ncbi:MAG: hypothetical protein KGQ54_04150, partial [Verrucomicrobia bacterium]|nr:hypothetical protein [Verrucomicrobiota bacterium]